MLHQAFLVLAVDDLNRVLVQVLGNPLDSFQVLLHPLEVHILKLPILVQTGSVHHVSQY